MSPDPSQLRDYGTRTKGPSPLGTSLFVAFRLLGPATVYAIIVESKRPSYGGSTGLLGVSASHWLILLMATGGSLKQIFWILAVSEQQMPAWSAVFLGLTASGMESLNALLFMYSVPFGGFYVPRTASSMTVGVFSYVLGLFLETASEIQRRNFKRSAKNQGKPYGGGLFSLATNINYGGHVLWKAGSAMASGGWLWGLTNGGALFYDFATRGVPVMDQYCQNRVFCSSIPLNF